MTILLQKSIFGGNNIDMSFRSKVGLILVLGTVLILLEYWNIMVSNLTAREPGPINIGNVPKEDFQNASDDSSMFVYSAYFDKRAEVLRVIGVTNRKNKSWIRCVLHYKQRKSSLIVNGTIRHLPESHKLRYTAAYFLCNLTNVTVPDEVSIHDGRSKGPVQNFIRVRNITQEVNKHLFSACVAPLHSHFDDSVQIEEWIELNRLLGVNMFTFYINSVSKKTLRVLKYYEQVGIANLLPWTLPHNLSVVSHKQLHYCGQMAALNDCLYKSKGKSKFITAIDLDEFIIPQYPNDSTWSDMLSRLPEKSAYIIRCSFFKQGKQFCEREPCNKMLTIDSYRLRDDLILPPHKRSKFIVKPDDVITLGIHFTWEMLTGKEYAVKPEIGLLHHYRRREKKHYTNKKITLVVHYVAQKYSKSLHMNLERMQEDFLQYSKH